MSKPIDCSTIIPTIGRVSLGRAVESVLQQNVNHHRLEVIVVNDSGKRLRQQPWMKSDNVQVIETRRRERSVARNTGAAIAAGRYLHFLDDDDWMLPEALQELLSVADSSGAAWIFGGYRLLDRHGELLVEARPDESGNCAVRFAASEWLPLQASIIRSEAFFEVGGFASLESLLGGFEDIDLTRQIGLKYEIAGTNQLAACIHFGRDGSTTDHAQWRPANRVSREKMLDVPGAPKRLYKSARTRSRFRNYWHGRLVWCYLASLYWNIKHKRVATAMSRLTFAVLFLSLSARFFLSKFFWLGIVGRQHIPGWLNTDQTRWMEVRSPLPKPR